MIKYLIHRHRVNEFLKNEELLYSFNLDKNSLVFDVGGYKGDFSIKIFQRYGCNIFIFEPVKNFADNIRKRFKGNIKIKVFNFGLSDKTGKALISFNEDSSSLYGVGNKKKIMLKSVMEFLNENKIKHIDLLKLNVEGEEYKILDSLISWQHIIKINNILVQFHTNFPDYKKQYLLLKEWLEQTHKLIWRFPFVWELWKKKL